MASGQGYERAKNLLKEHFGNEMKIAAAYMEKAMTWPMMRVDDINALQSFNLFKGLLQCHGRFAAYGGDECAIQSSPDNDEVVI